MLHFFLGQCYFFLKDGNGNGRYSFADHKEMEREFPHLLFYLPKWGKEVQGVCSR